MPAPFRLMHRVAYSECTVGNHVYYGNYLPLLERGRGEFFREHGLSFVEIQQAGLVFPVTECRIRYDAPARYDDLLAIEVILRDVTRVRLLFEYRVFGPGERLLVSAATEHVCASIDEKPRRMPLPLYDALRLLVGDPPT